jgi:hypothetical protein
VQAGDAIERQTTAHLMLYLALIHHLFGNEVGGGAYGLDSWRRIGRRRAPTPGFVLREGRPPRWLGASLEDRKSDPNQIDART